MSLRHPVAHTYTRTRKQTDASYGTVVRLGSVAGTSVFVCICVCMRVRLVVCVCVGGCVHRRCRTCGLRRRHSDGVAIAGISVCAFLQKSSCKRDYILQKRPIILSSLLTVAPAQ